MLFRFEMMIVFLACLVVVGAYPQIPNMPSAADALGGWFTTLLEIDALCLAMDTWQKVVVVCLC